MQTDSNLAYAIRNLEQQQVRQEEKPQIQKVEKTGAVPKSQIVKVSIGMLYVIVLCAALIFGKVALTETNARLQQTKNEMVELQSEQARLDSELSGLVSLKTVEERARELGLDEMKSSQVDYVVVSHDNSVEVIEEEKSVLSSLTKLYQQVKEYILN